MAEALKAPTINVLLCVQRIHSLNSDRWLISIADVCSVMQYDIPVCVMSWTSWQPETDQDPQGLKVVQITTVMADPDQQPGGHYHQSLVSTWQVAVAAQGKASDNHIIVFGETSRCEGYCSLHCSKP